MTDRTSQLPEHLLHHILSFLDAKESSRTSVLSKTWLHAFSTNPILDLHFHFDYSFYYHLYTYHRIPYIIKQELKKFLIFVENRLTRYSQLNQPLQTFRLHIIQHIDFRTYRPRYVLPQFLTSFAAKTLVELSLFNCYFDKEIIRPGKVDFSCLKKLEIGCLILHDWMFYGLLSNCRRIEEVRIIDCNVRFGYVSFAKVPSLERLEIEHCFNPKVNVVQIKSSSVKSIVYLGGRLLNIEACRNLKKIVLSNRDGVTCEEITDLSKFPLLEDLELSMCKWLEKLNISSPSLKRLMLSYCSELEEVKIDAPKLILFDYRGDTFPAISLVNTTEILKVHLVLSCQHTIEVSSTWLLNLREFLGSHSNLQTDVSLTLEILSQMKWFEISDFNDQVPKPEVGKLILRLGSHRMMNRALLDGIFWNFRPTILCIKSWSVSWSESDVKLEPLIFEFLWKNIMSRAGDQYPGRCCINNDDHQINCWRHYLKDAKAETAKGAHDGCRTYAEVLHPARDSKEVCFRLNWKSN